MPEKNGHSGFRYDWTPEVWGWTPDMGRWSLGHGRPRTPVSLAVSTDGIAPGESYDFWRETVFYAFDADRRERDEAGAFQARVAGLISQEAAFYSYLSDAVSGCRTSRQANSDGYEDLDLGLVLTGQRRHRLADDQASVADASGFFFYDSTKPSQVAWDAHRGMHLTLRRPAVEAALGGTLPSAADVARALDIAPLAPVLRSQMRMLAQHMDQLGPSERAFLLDQTAQLALFTLRGLPIARGPLVPEPSRAAILAAAWRYIEAHLSHGALNADRIANALGISRATLYRAFADNERTVAGTIREMRLDRARLLLELKGEKKPVAAIALECGFSDVPNFNRSFRRRFGVSPREARDRARD